MIRVPRRTPERIIPIQYDTKISAVKKAIQQTVQHVETEMTSEEVHQELVKEQITPMAIEKEEDAVKAASAEVIEAMTIGVAETAGGEAGEEAGGIAGAKAAKQLVAEAVAKEVARIAEEVGMDMAGEMGVKAAMASALEIGQLIGAEAAEALGAQMGSEVGRAAGTQAASVAAAGELAKMNMAEITEEKAAGLRGQVHKTFFLILFDITFLYIHDTYFFFTVRRFGEKSWC